MTFVTVLALAVAALVAAPYLAHRLRRQRAEEHLFAAARLATATPPKARRRSQIEHKALFALRSAGIVALALLGASPLVKCSKVALSRGGASVAVAIVLDDSMSMRAVDDKGRSRFARAKHGAHDILASLRDGDAAAIVLAGGPPRVGLAATTDVSAAVAALDGVTESDRATDLDGAIAIAKTLIAELPQIDRRVVVLSDLADGRSDATPIGEGSDIPIWIAMPELRGGDVNDCAILTADRSGGRARVRIACSTPDAAKGREVVIKDGEQRVASAPLPETALGEATITVVGDETKELAAELTGKDAIGADDRAPVVVEAGPAALAVVGDRTDEGVATGGAPIIEQALSALHIDMAVRPIPQPPDRREDTAPFAAIAIDDPPGFTPEQRHALSSFVESGGVLLLTLGPRAASAPLGANFEPFLTRAVTWSTSPVNGADPTSGAASLGEAASSFADLAAKGRAKLADEDVSAYESLVRWSDGVPLVTHHPRGRGEVWISTLPFSVDISDFALRPAFLAVLDAFVTEAKQRSVPRRSDVGVAWPFPGAHQVEVTPPNADAPIPAAREDGVFRITPPLVGAYRLSVDGNKELRVAAPIARELDMRPRAVVPAATSSDLGGGVAVVDISWVVALVLLGLLAVELVVRALTRAPENAEAKTASTETSEHPVG